MIKERLSVYDSIYVLCEGITHEALSIFDRTETHNRVTGKSLTRDPNVFRSKSPLLYQYNSTEDNGVAQI